MPLLIMKLILYFILFLPLFPVDIVKSLGVQNIADAISLTDIEKIAIEHNLQLKITKLEGYAKQSDVKTAGLFKNPVLYLVGDILPDIGSKFSPNDKQYGFNVAFPIDVSGKRKYRIETAQALAKAGMFITQDVFRQLLLNVRISYYDLQLSNELLIIMEDSIQTYKKLVELNEKKLHNNQIPASELSRSLIALQTSELIKDDLLAANSKIRDEFGLLVGFSSFSKNVTSLSPINAEEISLENSIEYAKKNRPDLIIAHYNLLAADMNKKLQRANVVDDLSLSVNFSNQTRTHFYGISLSFPLPIFDRNQGEIEKSKYNYEQAIKEQESIFLTIESNVRTAYSNYVARKTSLSRFINTSENSEGILKKSLLIKESAEFSYMRGAISLIQLLDAVQAYIEVYRSYVTSIANFNKSLALLDAEIAKDVLSNEVLK